MIVATPRLPRLAGEVAMVDGCFDPLHAGHLEYFTAAASLGRPLLCNVQSDDYIGRTKGRANLLPEDERLRLIDSLRPVSYAHLCTTSTADVLRRLRPAVYVKGADWRGRLPQDQVALCAELGVEIVFLDTVTGSSSATVDAFLSRNDRVRATDAAGEADSAPSSARGYRAVVTSHSSEYLSGVARFNRMLADRLGVPLVGLRDSASSPGPLLLSVKLTEGDAPSVEAAEEALDGLLGRGVVYDVFLHGFDGSALERRLVGAARHVYAGNEEIAGSCAHLAPTTPLWCPLLLDADDVIPSSELTLLSFGMAHKVRVDRYAALRDRLDGIGADYTLLVSTAFHEKAGLGEIGPTSDGLRELFGDRVRLLGFLSDAALNDFLRRADLFVAFFPRGARANNTSVLAAMAAGRPVLTNLDGYSPGWMRHGVNVLDLDRLGEDDLDADRLASLGRAGREDAAAFAGWAPLVERLSMGAAPAAASDRECSPSGASTIDSAARRAIPSR